LLLKGFPKNPKLIDFDETYSPVVDATTFRYLISLIAHEGLNFHMLDVVTTYLYDSLDSDIYMKLPEGFNFPEANSSGTREDYSIKLNESLYGLKQSGRMWCNALSNYLIILLDDMVYVYILYDFDDFVTCDVLLFYCLIK